MGEKVLSDHHEVRETPHHNSISNKIELRESINTEIFEILNQRWSLLIVRELALGRVRFNELNRISGVNPNTLRDRLRDLERMGIVDRTVVSAHPNKVEYRLTESGLELGDIFHKFDEWHERRFQKPIAKLTKKTRKPRAQKAVVEMEEISRVDAIAANDASVEKET